MLLSSSAGRLLSSAVPVVVPSTLLSARKKIPLRLNELWGLLYHAYIEEFVRKYKRIFFTLLASLSLLHVAINVYIVPRLNMHQLPQISKALTKVTGRDVCIQKIEWIAPTGLMGLHPIGRIQGVSVGSGFMEKSRGTIDTVDVKVDPLKTVFLWEVDVRGCL
jgi:hypothetical protein